MKLRIFMLMLCLLIAPSLGSALLPEPNPEILDGECAPLPTTGQGARQLASGVSLDELIALEPIELPMGKTDSLFDLYEYQLPSTAVLVIWTDEPQHFILADDTDLEPFRLKETFMGIKEFTRMVDTGILGTTPWSILCQDSKGVHCQAIIETTTEVRATVQGKAEVWGFFLNLIFAGGAYVNAGVEASAQATVYTNVTTDLTCRGPSSQWAIHGGGAPLEPRMGHFASKVTDGNQVYDQCDYYNIQATYFGLLDVNYGCTTKPITLDVDSNARVAEERASEALCHQKWAQNRPITLQEVPGTVVGAANPWQFSRPIGVGVEDFETVSLDNPVRDPISDFDMIKVPGCLGPAWTVIQTQ